MEWEEAPRRGLLNRGLFPALSLLGYETPEKVDGCHGVMYAPPAVKEVYFWGCICVKNKEIQLLGYKVKSQPPQIMLSGKE